AEYQDWQWKVHRFNESLMTLARAERVAHRFRLHDEEVRSIDQYGAHLQELGRVNEAVKFHQKAAKMAGHSPEELQETVGNNHGEALRKLGRYRDAQSALEAAESLAMRRGDVTEAISIMHNRAIATEQAGDAKAAQ